MTVPEVVGGILIAVGLAFLLRGWGLLPRTRGTSRLASIAKHIDPAKLIDAVTGLVKALTKAPAWLGATIIGIILILLGAWIGGWLPVLHNAA